MKNLFFAFALLLAGCRSERVAFQFQSVAPAVGAAARSHAAAPGPTPAAGAAVAAATPAAGRLALASRRPGPRRAASAAAPATAPPALAAAPVAAPKPNLAQRLVLKHLGRPTTHGQARVAESGLGGIALFFIGVVLAVLAGLGALVSLIPGVSFFGGVGLAAAGLLVIFLLYSLLSGGKEKKPAAK